MHQLTTVCKNTEASVSSTLMGVIYDLDLVTSRLAGVVLWRRDMLMKQRLLITPVNPTLTNIQSSSVASKYTGYCLAGIGAEAAVR